MRVKAFFISFLLGSASLSVFASETVTNKTILDLLDKGYATQVIINHIDAQENVRLCADIADLDALIAAGADNSLLEYVQKKSKAPKSEYTGLYWWNVAEGSQPQKLNLVPIEKKTSSIGGGLLGSALNVAGTMVGVNTGSIATLTGTWITSDILSSSGFKSDKLYIKGGQSKLKINTMQPVFRFTVAEKDDNSINTEDWYGIWMGTVQSPNEFQLIQLKSKGKGDKATRVFPSKLKWSTVGYTSGDETSLKNLVNFEIRQISPREYEVYFPQELEKGEYAFVYRNATHPLIKDHFSAFDFSVE